MVNHTHLKKTKSLNAQLVIYKPWIISNNKRRKYVCNIPEKCEGIIIAQAPTLYLGPLRRKC